MLTRDRTSYLPSLDGWRCVAILGVLWAHDWNFDRLAGPERAHYRLLGGFGVPLFYAISGFLIAGRIAGEEEKTGRFRLRDFYVRRFFRIQPPQWVFLAVVGLLMVLGAVPVTWHYWLGAFLLYENFQWHNLTDTSHVVTQSLLVGHFWTLAVEEHFYLLISLFFIVVKRRRAATLGGGLLAIVFLQHWGQHHGWYSQDVSSRRTYWNIQWLLFASLAALLMRSRRVLEVTERYWRPWVAFLTTGVLLYGHEFYTYGMRMPNLYELVFANGETLSFCFTGWIVATTMHPASPTTRVLEWRPIRFVGRISYSLYLWHVLFFLLGSLSLCTWPWLVHLNAAPWKYLCTFAVAALSYYGVEKPMIRMGHRLAPAKRLTSGDPASTNLATV